MVSVEYRMHTLTHMARIIYTYFVSDELGRVKIGRSRNVDKRLKALQTSNSAILTLLGSIPQNRERMLHHKFASYRLRDNSEWFTLSEEIISYIRTECNKYRKGTDIVKVRQVRNSENNEIPKWYPKYIEKYTYSTFYKIYNDVVGTCSKV